MSQKISKKIATCIFLGGAVALIGCDALEKSADIKHISEENNYDGSEFTPSNCSEFKLSESYSYGFMKKYSRKSLDNLIFYYSSCSLDYNKLVVLLREGVRREDATYMYTLAGLLYEGREFESQRVKKNKEEAMLLYERAAKLGDKSSIERLRQIRSSDKH